MRGSGRLGLRHPAVLAAAAAAAWRHRLYAHQNPPLLPSSWSSSVAAVIYSSYRCRHRLAPRAAPPSSYCHPASPAVVALLAASAAAQPAAPSNGAAPPADGASAANGSSGGGGAKGPWTEISSSIVLAVPTDYLLDGNGRSQCMDMVDR